MQCSFSQVLLLDADALPLMRPEALFDDPIFRRDGNLFWPDYWGSWVKPGVWAWAGLNASAVQVRRQAGSCRG